MLCYVDETQIPKMFSIFWFRLTLKSFEYIPPKDFKEHKSFN